MHELLIEKVLKASSWNLYAETIREFINTPNWSRLPNPVYHHWSYSYNQYGLITQINSFVLCMILRDSYLQNYCLENISSVFIEEIDCNCWTVNDIIVNIYILLPNLQYVAFTDKCSLTSKP